MTSKLKQSSAASPAYPQSDKPLKGDAIHFAGIANHARIEKTLKAVKTVLDGGGVPFVVLKGPQISDLYDDPYARQMSDLDILVEERNFRTAKTLLTSADFALRGQGKSKSVSGLSYNTALFAFKKIAWLELHKDVAPHGRYNLDVKGLISRSVPFMFGKVEVNGLSNGDLLLHLCIHIAKDYFILAEKKHFNDIAVLLKKRPINWGEFINDARSAGVASAAYYILQAVRIQFEAPVPDDVLRELKPSVLRRIWLDHYLDPGVFPVYRYPEHKGLGLQLRMALPLMDGVIKGQGAFIRYAVLRLKDMVQLGRTISRKRG